MRLMWWRKPRCKSCKVLCDWPSSDLVNFTAVCPCCRSLLQSWWPERIQTTVSDRPSPSYWTLTFVGSSR